MLSKPLSQDEWRAVFRAIAEREGGGAAASSIWLQTSAFTHADVGRYVSIAGERVKVWTGAEDADGRVRQVRWEFAHPNVDGRIVSVDERIGGRVALEDGSHFLNPELEDVSVALRQAVKKAERVLLEAQATRPIVSITPPRLKKAV